MQGQVPPARNPVVRGVGHRSGRAVNLDHQPAAEFKEEGRRRLAVVEAQLRAQHAHIPILESHGVARRQADVLDGVFEFAHANWISWEPA